ncbi:STAS domain-containing protein [Pseudooceanicola sp. CBS1P-1]|uniref:Anti-sigma factor antagonist n=1 Tax=Pseudooceanicola albus TaxID=2692189 RepID=A0A6L7G6R6_9RHOB|nr:MULTISPECIES: STAS domain-containing protein [Pseudooceanicola]MBT9383020.1 STAS domain-containing protein [Pseudooceanicola endophyticus]MXN19208.1 anti-sigma factor antagonist [Pseudooceanicola albus]
MIRMTEETNEGICVVSPGTERLTAANASMFKEEMLALVDDGKDRLVIDFSDVTFLDSSGLGALVGLLKRVGNRGDIVVCTLADNVQQMFRITRMNKVFASYADAASAVRALKERV